MKTIRLPLAMFLALSLILSPAASLAQGNASSTPDTSSLPLTLAGTNWCLASDLNGWNNASDPMYDDGTSGDVIAGDGFYSLVTSIPTPGTFGWIAVDCGNWGTRLPRQHS